LYAALVFIFEWTLVFGIQILDLAVSDRSLRIILINQWYF